MHLNICKENESEKQIAAIYVLHTHLLLFQIQNPLIGRSREKENVRKSNKIKKQRETKNDEENDI